MMEVILGITAACALIGALFAVLSFLKIRVADPREPATKEVVAQLLRQETDLLRIVGQQQARDLRQELGLTLKNFQQITLAAFSALREAIEGQVRAFGDRLDTGIKTIDQRAAAIAEKLNEDISSMRTEANTNREGPRQLIESKLDASGEQQASTSKTLREELSANFQRLSLRVADELALVSAHQKERLEQTTQAMTLLGERNERSQEALKQTVEARLEAIRQENSSKLEEMRITVDEKLQTTLDSQFSKVVEQLARVYEGLGEMKDAASKVGDLSRILTSVKARGMFGEGQLELLLDEFLTPDQYIKNAQVKDGTQERVEFAIRFRVGPDGDETLLPVDSKFPREDYEQLILASESGDTQAVATCKKQLENRIKASAKEIRDKYVNPPKITEFAILFLPTESLYAEVLRIPGLLDQARAFRVAIAGPTTFAAILHAYQLNFRSLAIAKQSTKVWELLSAVRTEFGRYNNVIRALRKQLGTASKSVEELGKRTRIMDRTLQTVEKMPSDGQAQAALGIETDEIVSVDFGELPSVPGPAPSDDTNPKGIIQPYEDKVLRIALADYLI
jgi:DNA recombination protein RmuC